VKGPLFHYGGPFHFKPTFTIGGKERAPGGTTVGSTSPGHTVTGGGHVANAPAPAPPATEIVRAAPAAATAPRSAGPSSALWLLLPAGLLALAAVAAVLFEPKDSAGAVLVTATTGSPARRRED
jgi:hypothetical protein